MIGFVETGQSRYEVVSRRALLKASAGLGVALVLPACANTDASVFAGATLEPASPPDAIDTPTPVATTMPVTQEVTEDEPEAAPTATLEPSPTPEPTAAPEPAAAPDPTATPDSTAAPEPAALAVSPAAVAGEMVISFTYTQGATGKSERPYIAVWVENEAGELAETISLWYQQDRRGQRWLDHLDRWWDRDQARIAAGGTDGAAVVSSATRQAGSYTVVWDGTIDGLIAPAARYFLCVESAREPGVYSLSREPFDLVGSLPETAMADHGELSGITVRTSV